jgi:kynurenine 3-monooxygenase
MKSRSIAIIGGGPVGALTSIYLAKRGFGSTIFEKRLDPRHVTVPEGRSINLALSRRGLDALKPIGLYNEIMKIAIPLKGRMMHGLDGSRAFQPYGKNDREVIYAVSRNELNVALLKATEQYPGIHFSADHRCEHFDALNGIATLKSSGGTMRQVQADTFFGCDGAGSILRQSMESLPGVKIDTNLLDYGYKEVFFPARPDSGYQMEMNALHIWPRGGYMLIALPNPGGSFTGTLFYPWEGEESFEKLKTESDVERFFESNFPDALAMIPDLAANFLKSPTGTLPMVKCSPWNVRDKLMLMGDAAHGIVPFLGQGLNCAMEGVMLLMNAFDKGADDWQQVFESYQQIRKQDTDAVLAMALDNFIEMRDRVANPKFLFQKKVELELERRFYPRYISRYSMIQFHHTPYSRALAVGKINDDILNVLTRNITSIEEVDWTMARLLVDEKL